jgi:MFS transporter, DHA1 family, inner membrane transport protein
VIRHLRGERGALLYVVGAIGSGGYVYTAFLAPLWALALGAPPAVVGLIAGAGALLASLLTVPAGALVDRRGARPVLCGAAALAAAATLLFPFAQGYWWLMPLQIAVGLGRTVAWVAAQTYLIQTTPSGLLARRTSWFGFLSSGGAFAAPLVGGLLVDWLGYGVAFGVGGVAYAIMAGGILTMPHAPPGGREQSASVWQAYRRAALMLLRVGVLVLVGGTMLRQALISLRSSFFPIYLLQLDVTTATIGFVVSAGSFAGVVATPAAIRLQGRWGAGRVLFLALLGGVVAVIITGTLHDLLSLALVSLVWGMATGITLPALISLVAQQTGATERGLGTALRNTGNEWAMLVSPIVFGLIADRTGIAPAFVVVGLALLLAGIAGLAFQGRLTDEGARGRADGA